MLWVSSGVVCVEYWCMVCVCHVCFVCVVEGDTKDERLLERTNERGVVFYDFHHLWVLRRLTWVSNVLFLWSRKILPY